MKLVCSTEFACAPERLWSFLDEGEKRKLWMKGVLEDVETSSGPRGTGSTFRMKIKEGGRVGVYDGEVVAYDPPRHLGVKLTGPAFRDSAMFVHYRLADLGARTHLDYEASIETKGWMKILGPLFVLFGRLQLKSFFRTLKALAEAPAA
jgi:hypothetical protein